jgi:uncharacterized membrane protein
MVDKNIYDDLEVGEVPKQKMGFGGLNAGRFVIVGIVALMFIAVILVLIFGGANTTKRTEAAKNLPVTETNSEVIAVKAFAAGFLDKFYWYNRDSFLEVRAQLEKMMTTNFLEKFKQVYYDNQFEQDIADGSLIISPTYDAIMYSVNPPRMPLGTYARVLGDIKYENGRTGAARKRVSTWTLKIVSEDGQYLVDDFVIEIGR